jgi:hypothetical protein
MIRMDAFDLVPSVEDAADAAHARAEPALTRAGRSGANRQSTAELLQQLRREFPDSPLAVRVRALEALRRR